MKMNIEHEYLKQLGKIEILEKTVDKLLEKLINIKTIQGIACDELSYTQNEKNNRLINELDELEEKYKKLYHEDFLKSVTIKNLEEKLKESVKND